MSILKKVVANSLILLGGSITTQIINLVYIGVLARYLGVDGFGQISTATALIAVVFIQVNYGLDILLVREIAIDLKRASTYVSNAILLRIAFVALVSYILSLILYFSPYSEETKTVIWIYCLVNALDSISNAMTSIFNANQRMGYRAAIELGRQVINVSISVVGIYLGWTLVQLVWVSAFASLVRLLVTYLITNRLFTTFDWRLQIKLCAHLIRISFPFFVGLMLNVLTLRFTVIVLSWLDTEESVGLYSAALFPIITIMYVPDMIGDAVFPVMSHSYLHAPKTLAKIYNVLFRCLLIIGFPMGAGAMLISPEIMGIVYGDGFQLATILLMILSTYLFTIATYANGLFLGASKRQPLFNSVRASFTIAGGLLSIILVLFYSYFGAAIVFVLVAFAEFITLTVICHRYLELRYPWRTTTKVILSTILMTAIGYFMRQLQIPVILIVLISPFVYLYGLLITEVLTKEDWEVIRTLPVGRSIYSTIKRFRFSSLPS